MKLPPALFITGTDTDCGKTHVASALISAYKSQGLRVTGFKPVASGSKSVDGRLINHDVESLTAHANVQLPAEVINPYIFEPPISPHFAAEQSGVEIELKTITDAYQECQKAADIVIVEGAGGWRVPLSPSLDIAGLAAALNIPVVVVCGLRLGCINHMLLTVKDINSQGTPICAWVANQIDPQYKNVEDTLATIKQSVSAPLLAKLSHQDRPDPSVAAHSIDLAQIGVAGEAL